MSNFCGRGEMLENVTIVSLFRVRTTFHPDQVIV